MMDSNYKERLPNYNGPGTQPELPPFMNTSLPHPANPPFSNQAVQHLHRPPNFLPQLPGLPQPPSFPASMNFNVPPPTLASNVSSVPWFYSSSYVDGSRSQAPFHPQVPQFPPQPLPNVSVPPPPLPATVFQPLHEPLLTNRCPIPPLPNFVVRPPACSISHFDIPPPQLPIPQDVASVPHHLTSAAVQCRPDKPVYQREHGASNEFPTRLPAMGSTGLDSQYNNIRLSSADIGAPRSGQQEKVTHQLSTTASSFITSAEQLERKRDADLIKAYVSESCQRIAKRKRTSAHSMTVSEFQSLLKEAILLNNQLKDYCYKIQSKLPPSECDETVKDDDDDEQVDYSHMQTRIKEIEECLMIEKDYMKQRMQKIAAKRQYLKRRRQERYEFAQKKLLERAKLHEEMDKWHAERQSKELAVKMEAELKKSADATLAEVRRKITDVNQRLKLLSQMRKLRQLRRDKAKQRGISVKKSDDDMFNSRVDELTALLKQQLELYLAEQRALQVMLDIEQEETKEKEREKIKKTEDERLEKFERELKDWLFGIDDSTEQDHVMAPYRQYYDLANHSVDALIKIRAEWDAFVVPAGTPGATGVPYSWVTPSEPTDDVWASALKSSIA